MTAVGAADAGRALPRRATLLDDTAADAGLGAEGFIRAETLVPNGNRRRKTLTTQNPDRFSPVFSADETVYQSRRLHVQGLARFTQQHVELCCCAPTCLLAPR